MRLLFVPLVNLLLLLRALLGLPLRLLGARSRPAFVRFRLSGEPSYREPGRAPRLGLLGSQGRPEPATVTSLERLREDLALLARDPAIKGILLEMGELAVPPAKRDVLVKLLGDFRAAGKRVVAWAVSTDSLGYQVMCSADEVLLSPAGRLELVGYAAEATALSEGLGRLGIQAHFFRRGEYKTAPELFTHPQVSDIQRRTLEAFLDERYGELVDIVARGRRRAPEEVRRWIDVGPYSARRAAAEGLVDGLCDEMDLPKRLGLSTGEDEEGEGEGVESMELYRARLPWPPVRWRRLKRKPRLAVVPVSGMIVTGKGGTGVGPELSGSETVVKALRAAGRDRRSRAVVLYVASSGGSAVASEIILEAVQRVARKKPVIAFVDRVAASGGYMAALGAREIWATPHAIVGSIGVFGGKFDISGLLAKLGVHRTLITRGESAGMFSSSRGFTERERELMEAEMEETYQAFLERVARARGRTKEEIHALAEGRVYSGQRARAAGLVDRTEGGFEEACARAMELAKAPGPFELKTFGGGGRRFSLLRLLLGGGAQTGTYAFCPTAWSLEGFGRGERFE
ncbi:peptidase S49 [Cystobacter fuscus DSM 2262]|uniref:Peptidase S49 n=1 Tax=Cystobacter fuscus (strain ATCC 25194 / DSM 2262 / NBRC 100088 / M29) TaxID=1242864 RepID=S9QP78_CYSF2|nr:signal peptide peptidase SppA [Cystobacter fuscus]EPX58383.1 peptidase S49 [Cystobacter fuscus DSM 2262]